MSSIPTPKPGPREVRQPKRENWPREYQPPIEKVCRSCMKKHTEFQCPHCRLEDFI